MGKVVTGVLMLIIGTLLLLFSIDKLGQNNSNESTDSSSGGFGIGVTQATDEALHNIGNGFIVVIGLISLACLGGGLVLLFSAMGQKDPENRAPKLPDS